MSTDTTAVFDNLKRIAEVQVQTYGRHCEVAIHDFSNLPHSLIHIVGEVTQRRPGAPVTDLVLEQLRKYGDDVRDLISYKTITRDGRVLKASTTFIRDSTNRVIGAYCINFDITDYLNTVALVEDFAKTESIRGMSRNETLASTLGETIDSLMDQAIQAAGKQPPTMNRNERVQMVADLESKGAFMLRGAVDFIAKALGVSKFTVYNYLKEIRQSQTDDSE